VNSSGNNADGSFIKGNGTTISRKRKKPPTQNNGAVTESVLRDIVTESFFKKPREQMATGGKIGVKLQ